MKAQEETRKLTVKLLAEIAETDIRSIRDGQRLREDLGLDSLQSLELLSSIGEALKIDLDVEQAMGIRTVNDACRFVATQYAEQCGHGDRRAR